MRKWNWQKKNEISGKRMRLTKKWDWQKIELNSQKKNEIGEKLTLTKKEWDWRKKWHWKKKILTNKNESDKKEWDWQKKKNEIDYSSSVRAVGDVLGSIVDINCILST